MGSARTLAEYPLEALEARSARAANVAALVAFERVRAAAHIARPTSNPPVAAEQWKRLKLCAVATAIAARRGAQAVEGAVEVRRRIAVQHATALVEGSGSLVTDAVQRAADAIQETRTRSALVVRIASAWCALTRDAHVAWLANRTFRGRFQAGTCAIGAIGAQERPDAPRRAIVA